jgi:PAS domain S-box-containing protein
MKPKSNKFDITEQSKKDLLRLLRVYQQAVDLNIICSITDIEGIIIYVNRKFCEVSQFSKEELIGQNHNVVNSGFHPREFFENMWNNIKSGNVWEGEVKSKAKDGSFFWLHSIVIPVFDSSGNILQFFSMRFPIDEKKKAEDEKREHILSLEKMLFMTSHQVRQPIANIMGIANQLEGFTNSSDEMIKMVGYIKQSVLSLDTFTRELTTFIYEEKETSKQIEMQSIITTSQKKEILK